MYRDFFAGMSWTPGGVQKVCAKQVRAHFLFPTFIMLEPFSNHTCTRGQPCQQNVKFYFFWGSDLFTCMLSICCPRTILGDFYRVPEKSSKKIRSQKDSNLTFSWLWGSPSSVSRRQSHRENRAAFSPKQLPKSLSGANATIHQKDGSAKKKKKKSQDFISCYRTPGPQKGLWRVSEGVSEGFEGSSYLSAEGPFKDPSKTLQNAFKNPSKTFQEGVEIDDAPGFLGLKNQFQGPGVL